MTREEKIQQMLDDWVSVKICEKAMIDDINEIYDDLKSRRCENCKYVENDNYMFCSLADNAFFKGDRLFKAIVNDNMSCSKFERKDK